MDSLKKQLGNESDVNVLATSYAKITKLYANNFDSALYYSQKYKQLALATNDSKKIADAYYQLADLYYNYNYDSTLFYVSKYLDESIRTKDTSYIADAYNFLAYANSQKGELLASLENYQKALAYFTIVKDSSQIASCYINLGYTISFGQNQTEALSFFLKGLRLAETIHDSILISDAYYNVGYYYERIKDNNAAFEYYQKALDLSLNFAIPDSTGTAVTYTDLAKLSLKLNRKEDFYSYMLTSKNWMPKKQTNYEKANLYSCYTENYLQLKNIDSVQHYISLIDTILHENSFEIIKAYTLQYKGRLALLKKNYRQSIDYLEKSIDLFQKNNSVELFSETYQYLAQAFSGLNQYKEAYNWQLKSNSIEDSLNMGAIQRMLTEFEQNKVLESELRQNKLEMELEHQKIENSNLQIKTKFRVSVAAIVLLLLFITIAIFYYRTIQKNNTLLQRQNKLIEDQKQLLENHVQKLKESENKLKELNATKDKFFSIIAHDLRNPFNSIIGISQLFLNNEIDVDPKATRKIMTSMNQTANFGFSLLENLLAWSRTQTGNMVPRPESIQLNKIIEYLIVDFQVMAEGKQINISFEPKKTASAYADKNMITTVLRNLMHNAIKFSYENSTINLTIHQENNTLITSIKDEGIGISQKDIPNLYKIDQPIQKLGTHKEKGSGLGLILCKEFIEKNQGKLTFESNKGQGSTFSFSLPIYVEGN